MTKKYFCWKDFSGNNRNEEKRGNTSLPVILYLSLMRGLVTVRSILINIGVLVWPDQVAVRSAHDAFADDGSLKDAARHEAVERLGIELTGLLAKLKGGPN
jgi:hypothetical protein